MARCGIHGPAAIPYSLGEPAQSAVSHQMAVLIIDLF
jgi:hypothetical protein